MLWKTMWILLINGEDFAFLTHIFVSALGG